jgi:hypothetical protein
MDATLERAQLVPRRPPVVILPVRNLQHRLASAGVLSRREAAAALAGEVEAGRLTPDLYREFHTLLCGTEPPGDI